jgi:hypothetical protein
MQNASSGDAFVAKLRTVPGDNETFIAIVIGMLAAPQYANWRE